MYRSFSLGFTFLLLLVSFTGICVADEAPSYVAYIQGGESSITNGSDGTFAITVKDIVPYFHIAGGEKSRLIPVELLTNMTYPMNAALVLSGADNETTVMVQVANVSLTDRNNILTLQADPLEYYEGERLKSFNGMRQSINALNDLRFVRSAIYLEGVGGVVTNSENCPYCEPCNCWTIWCDACDQWWPGF